LIPLEQATIGLVLQEMRIIFEECLSTRDRGIGELFDAEFAMAFDLALQK
jgi:hypothetical protein